MSTKRDDIDPVTDRVHDTSWSANLEAPVHADDEQLVIAQSIEAIKHTRAGNHVNLVTHGEQGHPATYLHAVLDERFGDAITFEHVQQCGCGGHVTKVHVRAETTGTTETTG
jgi:putative CGCGG family rSAM target protein